MGRLRGWAVGMALVATACLSVPPSTRPPPPATLGTTTGKTFLFVYMIGSDLEGIGPDDTVNPQYGSNNLLQLVRGYQTLTPEERAQVEVVVAFGGSRRPGWEGITIADMPALIADSVDGRFGNGGDYIVDLPQVNMGEPAILTEVLRWVRGQAEAAGAQRIVVDFWDHGGALAGYGLPGEPGDMSVVEIASAFFISGLKADIIGFDACLMACLEVASLLKPYARYLVASEEVEPGHGWHYATVVRALGTKAREPTVEIAKAMVDSLIDPVEHRASSGKTLSVIDLARLDGVERALADFSAVLGRDLAGAYRPILKSSLKTRFYGDTTGGRRTTVDLVDYCRQLASRYPAVAGAAESVAAAVAAAVPYNRQDGSRPNSHGIAVMALANPAIREPSVYNRDSVPLPPWYALMRTVLERGRHDGRRPRISDLTLSEHQGRPGLHLRVVDDLGVLGVYGVYATQGAPGLPEAATGERMAFVLAEPATTLDDATDTYFVPAWDGLAFALDFGGGRQAIVPLNYLATLPGGVAVYNTLARWNGREVILTVAWAPQSGQGGLLSMRPLIAIKGQKVPSRAEYQLAPGDTLSFAFATAEPGFRQPQVAWGPPLTVTPAMRLTKTAVSGPALTIGAVLELTGRITVTGGVVVDPATP